MAGPGGHHAGPGGRWPPARAGRGRPLPAAIGRGQLVAGHAAPGVRAGAGQYFDRAHQAAAGLEFSTT